MEVPPVDDMPAFGPGARGRDPLAFVPDFQCNVFDALLRRCVGGRLSGYLLLGRRLAASGLIPCSAEAFARARQLAAEQARANAGEPVTRGAIYDELQFALGFDAAARHALLDAELEFEAEQLRALPGAQAALAGPRAAGERVVFLVDEQVDAAPVRRALERHGLLAPGDRIEVASDAAAGSDDLNRYEACAESFAFATEGLTGLLAGAARLARLSVPVRTAEEAALRDVAAGVAGPALVGYVLWVLRRAQQLGLRRLYFLARDGWILMRIAERLITTLGLDCEARYLYGGRQAWYVPTITGVAEPDLFWAIDHEAAGTSVEVFLGRIGISPAEIEDSLRALGFDRSTWSTPQPPALYPRLWSIVQDPNVAALLLARAAAERADALSYFEQEGLLGSSDWAAVDVGWRGRIVGALDAILRTQGGSVPAALFFGRSRDGESNSFDCAVPIEAFFFDHTQRRGHTGRLHGILFELFCGAEHGATTGYRRTPAGVVPRLDAEGNARLSEWGLPLVHRTILSFTDHLWLDGATVNAGADTRPAVAALLGMFSATPSPAEAAAWGAYPFEYGKTGLITSRLANPLRLRHVPRALLTGEIATRSGFEWTEAGLALSSAPVQFGLGAALRVRERLRTLRMLQTLKRLRRGGPRPPGV